jgi:uncharacterized membrane protein YozB (DUF420 family)
VELKKIRVSDLNLILQIIIFTLFLSGIFYIRSTKNVRRHRTFMGAAIILNLASIFLVMGRSLAIYFGILVETANRFGPAITWVHASIGSAAEVLGIRFLYRHPKKIRLGMRITAALWTIALLLGITLYLYYYVLMI